MQWLYGTGGGGWWRGPKSEPAIGGVFYIIFYCSCFSTRTWRSSAASSNFPIFWLQFFYFPCRPFTVQYYSDSGYAIIYTPDHPEGVIVADPMGDCLPGEAKYRMHMSLTTLWLPCPTLIFHSPQVPAYRASLGMLPSCKNTVSQSIGRIFFHNSGSSSLPDSELWHLQVPPWACCLLVHTQRCHLKQCLRKGGGAWKAHVFLSKLLAGSLSKNMLCKNMAHAYTSIYLWKYLSSIVSILFEYDIRALTPTYMTIEIPER